MSVHAHSHSHSHSRSRSRSHSQAAAHVDDDSEDEDEDNPYAQDKSAQKFILEKFGKVRHGEYIESTDEAREFIAEHLTGSISRNRLFKIFRCSSADFYHWYNGLPSTVSFQKHIIEALNWPYWQHEYQQAKKENESDDDGDDGDPEHWWDDEKEEAKSIHGHGKIIEERTGLAVESQSIEKEEKENNADDYYDAPIHLEADRTWVAILRDRCRRCGMDALFEHRYKLLDVAAPPYARFICHRCGLRTGIWRVQKKPGV